MLCDVHRSLQRKAYRKIRQPTGRFDGEIQEAGAAQSDADGADGQGSPGEGSNPVSQSVEKLVRHSVDLAVEASQSAQFVVFLLDLIIVCAQDTTKQSVGHKSKYHDE